MLRIVTLLIFVFFANSVFATESNYSFEEDPYFNTELENGFTMDNDYPDVSTKPTNKSPYKAKKSPRLEVIPLLGVRNDTYVWSHTLSKLKWDSIVPEAGVKVTFKPKAKRVFFSASIKYGSIAGDSTFLDRDFDKLGEFSRTSSKLKGDILDISGEVRIPAEKKSVVDINYLYGIDYLRHNFKAFGLDVKIDRELNGTELGPTGKILPDSLQVTNYEIDTYAPWLGISLGFKINKKFSVVPTTKLYFFYSTADANWILRDDFKHPRSFTVRGLGFGASLDINSIYKITNNLDFTGNLGVKYFSAGAATEENFLANGSVTTASLNRLYLLSKYANIGLKYKF
ncbi:MAG: hypothetical protein HRU35_01560 [Rickettsiaceae bacterium]|nr:hypothetical protein [Rickettsiaceae bacterium]